MVDLFVLKNNLGERLLYIDISDKDTDFKKLIGFGLDPLIYRIDWKSPDEAEIWEYWWGTRPFSIRREQVMESTLGIQVSDIGLSKGEAASPSPWFRNNMI